MNASINKKLKALVVSGDGINCEAETAMAFKEVGMDCDILHINELLLDPGILHSYHSLAFPGGFSFGDEIRSGKIFSLKIKSFLAKDLTRFVADKKTVIGICNGFQVLVQLGVFNEPSEKRKLSLAHNRARKFIDKWSWLKVDPNSNSVWLKNIDELELPIRHGEGRILFAEASEAEELARLSKGRNIAIRYKLDVNGSSDKIAGLSDSTGQILGLMPHPEAYVFRATHYNKTTKNQGESCFSYGDGIQLFQNNFQYLKETFNESGI